MTVGPLEQDERTRRRTIPRCRATGRRTAGRVTPEPSYSGSPKLGHRAFCERRFPTRGARGVWRRRGRGIAGNTGQLPRVGERAKDPCAHLIGCPARAIRSSPSEVPSTARIGEKEVDFWQKVNGFFRDRCVTQIIRIFAKLRPKEKKAKKTAQPAVRTGSEKVKGLPVGVAGGWRSFSSGFQPLSHVKPPPHRQRIDY